MKPSSAKAKGRKLQQLVRDSILAVYIGLTLRDVESTSMGVTGADIKLSAAAFKVFPYAVECKSHATNATVTLFEQAKSHAKKAGGEPLLVVKTNGKPPIAVVTLDHFIQLTTRTEKHTHG